MEHSASARRLEAIATRIKERLRQNGKPDTGMVEDLMRALGWDIHSPEEIAAMPSGMEEIEYMPNYGDLRVGAPVAYLRVRGVPRIAIALCDTGQPVSPYTDFTLEVRDVFVYLEQQRTLPTVGYLLATGGTNWILYDVWREELLLHADLDDLTPLLVLDHDMLWQNEQLLDDLPRQSGEELTDELVIWLQQDGPELLGNAEAAVRVLDACLLVQAIIYHKLWTERGQIWLNLLRLPAMIYRMDRLLMRTLANLASTENLKLCEPPPAGSWQRHASELLVSIVGLSRAKFESQIFLAAYAQIADAPPAAPDDLDPETAMLQLAQYLEHAGLKSLNQAEIELTATREVLDAGIIYHTFMTLAEAYAETKPAPRSSSIGGQVMTLAERAAAEAGTGEEVEDIPARILERNLRIITPPGTLQAVQMSLALAVIDTYAGGLSRYVRFPDLMQAIRLHE